MSREPTVTRREHVLPADTSLVSMTDTKGRIVYCNPAFVAASGYSTAELMGQPHNIVRHPDMPAEAFRDLWATIGAGHPWTALVKNRRKNGDHYWVVANVTPVRSDGRVVGHLSVRTVPTRDQVDAAEALYATMRDEAARGRPRTALRGGRVMRIDPPGRLARELALLPRRVGPAGALWLGTTTGVAVASALLPPMAAAALVLAAAAAGLPLFRALEARPYRVVLDDMLQIASGDLAHEVRRDARGLPRAMQQALAQVAVNLRSVTRDIRTEALSVRGAADEIASGNQELSARTVAQAASLEQSAASMEQINGSLQHSAHTAREAAQLASRAAAAAERSNQEVQAVVTSIEAINDSAQRIGEIIGVIEGIAFQTNILALNAAVEAARAGGEGRGFAVVAGEVRALARRTTEASLQVKTLITESGQRVAAGQAQSARTHEHMRQALELVARVSRLLGEIDVSTGEQQLGVSQVNEAVTHLDTITQQNAAMVEELAASSRSLRSLVQTVDRSLAVFRLRKGDRSLAEADAVAMRRESQAAARPGNGDAGPFGLRDAAEQHLQWKDRLREAAAHGADLDVATIGRDDCCTLGRWLHGEGHRLHQHRPRFTELLSRHAEFHRAAAAVAELANAGRREQAMAALGTGSPFAAATQHTLLAINALLLETEAAPA